jgi:probable F420-dependent oxidoreductase
VTRELDDCVVIAGHRHRDLDSPVDRREQSIGRVEQDAVKFVHDVRDYGRAMRVDVMTFPKPLAQMGPTAQRTEQAGFDGMLFTEGGRTAYPAVTAAALAAPGLEMSTGVAVAFPRSPMITAQVAWELQELTGGRFRLGLGTQVRTHVVRRYGAEFERPGPRLRDYVRAVKACFAAFRGEPLDHHGEFYDLDFLNRQWSPGPIEPPDPKVDIAAVNPWMLRMAGEVADGVHVHPIGEPGYLARHVVPGIAQGATLAGRDPSDIAVIVPITTIVGDDDAEIAQARDMARNSLSFYGSTPNYAFIWDEAGFEGTTERIRAKQKAGDFEAMAAEITDDHLAVFCTEARWDDLADAVIAKYDGTVDRLVFYNPAFDSPDRFERYGAVARAISDRTAS